MSHTDGICRTPDFGEEGCGRHQSEHMARQPYSITAGIAPAKRIDWAHRDREAGCKRYFALRYGAKAERDSRGGVLWMRGCGDAS